jgi:ribosomal protein L40E
MSTLACTLAELSRLDTSDLDAVMQMNEACLRVLLDPTLWAWMIGLTLVSVAGGAWIGWIKGRVVAGVVWAALLGPIGWIIVALGKSKLPICSECGKANHAGAKTCRHCGVDLQKARQRTARSRLRGAESDVGW